MAAAINFTPEHFVAMPPWHHGDIKVHVSVLWNVMPVPHKHVIWKYCLCNSEESLHMHRIGRGTAAVLRWARCWISPTAAQCLMHSVPAEHLETLGVGAAALQHHELALVWLIWLYADRRAFVEASVCHRLGVVGSCTPRPQEHLRPGWNVAISIHKGCPHLHAKFQDEPTMQGAKGKYPGGHPGEEMQDWFLGRAFPAMCAGMEKLLASDDDLRRMHAQLQEELHWDEQERGFKLFFVSWDGAGAHTWTNFRLQRATKQPAALCNRLTAEKGTDGWVQLEEIQWIPSADKVPDCIQEPVECFLGTGKKLAKKLQLAEPGLERLTWQQMHSHVVQGFAKIDGPEVARKCWDQAIEALKVFSGERGKWVSVKARGKKRLAQCTGGGPVQKMLRG